MSDVLIRIGVATMVTKYAIEAYLDQLVVDQKKQTKTQEDEIARDAHRRADVLLPLGRAKVVPRTFFGRFSEKISSHQDVIRAVVSQLYPHLGEATVTNMTQVALANCVLAALLGLTYCEVLTLLGFIWKSIWILVLQTVLWSLHTKDGFAGLKNSIILLSALLIAEYLENQGGQGSTPFGIFHLSIFSVGAQLVSKTLSMVRSLQGSETVAVESQVCINRLASALFQESNGAQGYAILHLKNTEGQPHLGEDGQPRTEQQNLPSESQPHAPCFQPTLQRYNERFVKLLTKTHSGVSTSSLDYEARVNSFLGEGPAGKEEMTSILLDDLKIKSASLSYKISTEAADQDMALSLRQLLYQAVTVFQRTGKVQDSSAADSAPGDKSQAESSEGELTQLLCQDFFFESAQEENDLNNAQRLQQKTASPKGLEVRVVTLCAKRAMYLVKVNRITLARLQMPMASSVLDETTSELLKRMAVSPSSKNLVKKRKSSLSDQTFGIQQSVSILVPDNAPSQSMPENPSPQGELEGERSEADNDQQWSNDNNRNSSSAQPNNLTGALTSPLDQSQPSLQSQDLGSDRQSSSSVSDSQGGQSIEAIEEDDKEDNDDSQPSNQLLPDTSPVPYPLLLREDFLQRRLHFQHLPEAEENDDDENNSENPNPVFNNQDQEDQVKTSFSCPASQMIGNRVNELDLAALNGGSLEDILLDKKNRSSTEVINQVKQFSSYNITKHLEAASARSKIDVGSADESSSNSSLSSNSSSEQQRVLLSSRESQMLESIQNLHVSREEQLSRIQSYGLLSLPNGGAQESQDKQSPRGSVNSRIIIISNQADQLRVEQQQQHIDPTQKESSEPQPHDPQKIFVYKIIHDLRHPSQAIQDGFAQLIKQLQATKKSHKKLFSGEQNKYSGNSGSNRAARVLQFFAHKYTSSENTKLELGDRVSSSSLILPIKSGESSSEKSNSASVNIFSQTQKRSQTLVTESQSAKIVISTEDVSVPQSPEIRQHKQQMFFQKEQLSLSSQEQQLNELNQNAKDLNFDRQSDEPQLKRSKQSLSIVQEESDEEAWQSKQMIHPLQSSSKSVSQEAKSSSRKSLSNKSQSANDFKLSEGVQRSDHSDGLSDHSGKHKSQKSPIKSVEEDKQVPVIDQQQLVAESVKEEEKQQDQQADDDSDEDLCIDDDISEGDAQIDTKGLSDTKSKDMTRRIEGTIRPAPLPLPSSHKPNSLAQERIIHDHENNLLVKSTYQHLLNPQKADTKRGLSDVQKMIETMREESKKKRDQLLEEQKQQRAAECDEILKRAPPSEDNFERVKSQPDKSKESDKIPVLMSSEEIQQSDSDIDSAPDKGQSDLSPHTPQFASVVKAVRDKPEIEEEQKIVLTEEQSLPSPSLRENSFSSEDQRIVLVKEKPLLSIGFQDDSLNSDAWKSPHSDERNSQVIVSAPSKTQQDTTSSQSSPGKKPPLGVKIGRELATILSERQFLIKLVEKQFKMTSKMKRQMVNMKSQLEMMTSLMRDLMNQAQLQHNTFTLVNDYLNMMRLVKNCIRTMRIQSAQKRIQLVGPLLENPVDKYFFKCIYGDEIRLSQIIMNFVSNAIKFTPASGLVSVSLRVTEIQDLIDEAGLDQPKQADKKTIQSIEMSDSIESAPDKEIHEERKHPMDERANENLITISSGVLQSESQKSQPPLNTTKRISYEIIIKDSGCGISKENQKRLFKNFGKLEETQGQNKQGVGLGLSICQDIIIASGGMVRVESQINEGTEFTISLQSKCKVDEFEVQEAQNRYFERGSLSKSMSKSQSDDLSSQMPSHRDKNQQVAPAHNTTIHSSMGTDILEYKSMKLSSSYATDKRSGNLQQKVSEKLSEHHSMRSELSPSQSQIIAPISMKQQDSLAINEVQQVVQRKSDSSMISQRDHEESKEQQLNRDGTEKTQSVTRCLLANDNAFVLQGFAHSLQRHFSQVDTAEDGQVALDKVRSQPIDYYNAIILDINMPIMDGVEAQQKIQHYFDSQGKSFQSKYNQEFLAYRKVSGEIQQPAQLQSKEEVEHSYPNLEPRRSQVVFKSVGQKQRPWIYALTSDIDKQAQKRMKLTGFKAVFSSLSPETMEYILKHAGLEYVEKSESVVESSIPSMQPVEYNQGSAPEQDEEEAQKSGSSISLNSSEGQMDLSAEIQESDLQELRENEQNQQQQDLEESKQGSEVSGHDGEQAFSVSAASSLGPS